jgi:nitrate reductase molybdenum cofactor assembly chaperone
MTLAAADLLDLQERYVALFDRGRALSLHLFEHVHGESRDRGQAMVDLRDRYEAQGWKSRRTNCPITCRCSSNISRSCRPSRRRRNWPSRA